MVKAAVVALFLFGISSSVLGGAIEYEMFEYKDRDDKVGRLVARGSLDQQAAQNVDEKVEGFGKDRWFARRIRLSDGVEIGVTHLEGRPVTQILIWVKSRLHPPITDNILKLRNADVFAGPFGEGFVKVVFRGPPEDPRLARIEFLTDISLVYAGLEPWISKRVNISKGSVLDILP